MKFERLKRMFRSDGEALKDHGGRVRTLSQFEKGCIDYSILIDRNNLEQEYDECVVELYKKAIQLTKNKHDNLREAINPEEIFKDFEICEDGSTNPLIRYTNPITKVKVTMGTCMDADARFVYNFLCGCGRETMANWMEAIRPYQEELKVFGITPKSAVDAIVDNLYGRVEYMPRKKIDWDAPIVALEGSGLVADNIIPFERKHSTLADLNPILSSFLERTTDHKFLCAIIASRLLNFKHSYTPYLYGKGGDGKSTFVSFLDMLVGGLTGALKPEVSTFGLYGCVGKVFLTISDSGSKHVFNYELVKKISGYDKVSVESKYKNPIDLYLPGMIIITSNRMPEILQEPWFERRARIFTVKSLKEIKDNKGIIDPISAAKAMATTSNEFLNYCIQCLEEVGNIQTGEVPNHPSLEHLFGTKVSSKDMAFEDFLKTLGFIIQPESSIEGFTFRNKINLKLIEERKDSFFFQEFMDYIEYRRGVEFKEGRYYGITTLLAIAPNDGHTKFRGKEAT